ncbi:Alpha-1B adrenergic receptor [Stylophora pistillata]|uniref:Alpha-1B adrenergic receptor n=1 Tax=Stylophora pistillata TaxID=50429 RepID=A0A2B4SVZ4_STYPI|nr:Alpha-1B adrenergic receptor [Stylophora pistillata]
METATSSASFSNTTASSVADSMSVASLLSVVAMGCTMVFAIFGNVLVILAVQRRKNLRTTAAILVVNLALVDLSITVSIVPFVMTLAVTQEWVLPWVMCRLTGFINAFLTAGQMMALLHISVNRYIAVAYPHSAVLYLGVYKHVRSHGKRLFQKTLSLELTQYSDKKRTESTISRSIGEDNAPRTVSFDNLAVSTENIIDAGFTDLGEHSSASTRAKRSRRRKLMEARVTKVLLAVVMAFVCCWIPRGIANLWAIFESREAVPRALEYSSTVLVFFNAAVNPVLYGALHQDFQRAFRRIICCESNMNRSRAAINMSNSIR